jgi:D-glycero-beta-D-manno-heptose-7-phosphate kinase
MVPGLPARPSPEEADRLLQIIDRFAGRRVLVMGDFIADEFIYGRVSRISREAPVLILEYDMTEVVPGGAGNAANNVAALGARTRAVGLVGDDEMGKRMVEALHENVERRGVVTRRRVLTPTKTRILAGGIHSAKQQVVRMDRMIHVQRDAATQALFRRHVLREAARCDAVLVSDYGAGLISPALVDEVKETVAGANGAHQTTKPTKSMKARKSTKSTPIEATNGPRVPILIDSRYDLARYTGLTACTPNEAEVEALLGVQIDENPTVLERAGRELLDRMRHEAVLITRGSHGMSLFERGQPTRHLDIFGSDEIADVTGAGDTVIATMTLALAAGASPFEAMQLANIAGGLVVMKRGTATVSADELRDGVRAPSPRG